MNISTLAVSLFAATAMEEGEELLTGNDKHFRAILKLTVKAFRPKR